MRVVAFTEQTSVRREVVKEQSRDSILYLLYDLPETLPVPKSFYIFVSKNINILANYSRPLGWKVSPKI